MRWTGGCELRRQAPWMAIVAAAVTVVCGCGHEPETPPADRMVRVSLMPADREAIMDARFESIRAGILEIRAMEAVRPDPELDREAYAKHADEIDERTRGLVAVMADERWSREDRRLMQRVLRFATSEDLTDPPVDSEDQDGRGGD